MTKPIVLSRENKRTGDVWLSDFDRGVVTSLGAVLNSVGDMYIVNIPGVSPPPPSGKIKYEGIPVTFAFPDETIDNKIEPQFVVRRDDFSPALSRLHPGNQQYNVAAPNATAVTVVNPITKQTIATGYDRYESKGQAVPYDILYTIEIRARYRNNLKVSSLNMLRYTMRRFQPYCTIYVKDSLDELRSYTGFTESYTGEDTKPDVAGRETNFNVSLRVEGELDLNDPSISRAVVTVPTINYLTKRPV